MDIPLIVTEQYPKALGSTCLELDISKAKLLVAKTKFSMFVPEVQNYLKQSKIKSAVLFGIESHICVLQSCLDLLENGYQVYIIRDGISSCNQQEIPISVELMRKAGAIITTSESLMFQLVGDASHPKFKEISGLVKDNKMETKDGLELCKI